MFHYLADLSGIGLFIIAVLQLVLQSLGVDKEIRSKLWGTNAGKPNTVQRPRGWLIPLCLCGLWCLWATYSIFSIPEFKNGPPKIMVYGKTFRNEKVEVDDKDFDSCTFENVKYLYRGTANFNMRHCTFRGTRIITTEDRLDIGGALILAKAIGIITPDTVMYDKNGNITHSTESPQEIK